jgi:hypothetical protein
LFATAKTFYYWNALDESLPLSTMNKFMAMVSRVSRESLEGLKGIKGIVGRFEGYQGNRWKV